MDIYTLPAADGDCFLVVYEGNDNLNHSILIDGGGRGVSEFLKKRILELLNLYKTEIDLFIITHSDNDHIYGALNFVSDYEFERKIKKIWFNSEKLICENLKLDYFENQKYLLIENEYKSQTSLIQDRKLNDYLSRNKHKWHDNLIEQGLVCKLFGASLIVVSPTKEKLIELDKHWKTEQTKLENFKEQTANKGKYDYDIKIDTFDLVQEQEIDKTPTNGGSIAFFLEFEGKRILFSGDAHIDSITKYLVENYFKNAEKKISFDLIKLSHHGSKKNTTTDFVDIIDCGNFIISSNANRKDYFPEKETFARILKNEFRNKNIEIKFHFNYNYSILKTIFDVDDYEKIKKKDKFYFDCIFPNDNIKGLKISI